MKKKRTQQKQEEEEEEEEQERERAKKNERRRKRRRQRDDDIVHRENIHKSKTGDEKYRTHKVDFRVESRFGDDARIEKESIRLIYKGHVLKDEKTIRECSIGEGHAVHLVQSAPKKSPSLTSGGSSGRSPASHSEGGGGGQPTPPRTWMDDANASQRTAQAPDFATLFNSSVLGGGGGGGGGGASGSGGFDMFGGGGFGVGGMPNPTPEEIRAIENDPFVRQFMEQAMQDPEVLRPMMQVMEQNPQIQQLMNANPELRQAMQDPENISRALRASRDPNLMREQMAATDRTLANIESHPEGFNALRRMYENVEVPLQNAIQNSQNSEAAANNGRLRMRTRLQVYSVLRRLVVTLLLTRTRRYRTLGLTANAGTAGASTSQAQQQNPFAGLGGSGGFGGLNIEAACRTKQPCDARWKRFRTTQRSCKCSVKRCHKSHRIQTLSKIFAGQIRNLMRC